MTNKEAIELIKGIEEDGWNVTSKHIAALDLAIKAMEEERQYLLARGQTGAEHIIVHHCLPIIDNAPTVEPDMEFAKWVTEMIFGNNEVEDFDFELFSELACRKLEKLGLVKQTESEWKKKGGKEE